MRKCDASKTNFSTALTQIFSSLLFQLSLEKLSKPHKKLYKKNIVMNENQILFLKNVLSFNNYSCHARYYSESKNECKL